MQSIVVAKLGSFGHTHFFESRFFATRSSHPYTINNHNLHPTPLHPYTHTTTTITSNNEKKEREKKSESRFQHTGLFFAVPVHSVPERSGLAPRGNDTSRRNLLVLVDYSKPSPSPCRHLQAFGCGGERRQRKTLCS